MNFLAHGWHALDRPWELAGTAVPDLLAAFDRAARVRRRHAAAALEGSDGTRADVARGIVRHHDDDAWFHVQPTFVDLSLAFAIALREELAGEAGDVRFGFVGHILVEMLLDAALIAREPTVLGRYYEALAAVDPAALQAVVGAIGPTPSTRLGPGLTRFVESRFLEDYATDAGLLVRLNQVLARVTMPPLPARTTRPLARFRRAVDDVADALLPPAPTDARP